MNAKLPVLQQHNHFITLSLLNRLNMPVELDVCPIHSEGRLIIVARVHPTHHRSMLANNIHCLAVQLKRKYAKDEECFSLIEHRKKRKEEWWHWEITWAKKNKVSCKSYPLKETKVRWLKGLLSV